MPHAGEKRIALRSDIEMITYALEVEPELLPLVPELLTDLNELGGDASLIVEVLGDLALPQSTRVVDLGCGKGALAIKIAKELGFRVHGIELFEPFVKICQECATSAGIADRCTFEHASIPRVADSIAPYDIAIFAALGDVLGPLDETIGIIRRFVRPGGYLVVNDDFLRDGGSTAFPRFEKYRSHEETVRGLQCHGDVLVREVLAQQGNVVAGVPEETHIRRRAEQLAQQHPRLKVMLLAYADEQAREYAYLERNMVAAVWLLEKRKD
jgi:precorrin-6B methylase 2